MDSMISRPITPFALCLVMAVGACNSPTDETPPPPAAATLAFTMDSAIWVVTTADSATPSLLLPDFINPSWSPDGGTIAMLGTTDPRYIGFPSEQALYLADADGGNPRALTPYDWPIVERLLWAPDGSSLLYKRSRFLPYSETLWDITPAGDTVNGFAVGLTAPPSWCKGGTLIAIENSNISLVDPVTNDTAGVLPGDRPQCSPVNDDVAFREPVTGHIRLIRADSTGERDLQVDGYPRTWSPDGQRLAFEGNDGFYIIRPDGSHLTRIGPLNVEVTEVAWSPDSRRIAYVTRGTTGPHTIYMAGPDGADARPAVTGTGICCLSWRPTPP